MAFAKALNTTASNLWAGTKKDLDLITARQSAKMLSALPAVMVLMLRKKLSDEQVAALKTLIDQLPEADDL